MKNQNLEHASINIRKGLHPSILGQAVWSMNPYMYADVVCPFDNFNIGSTLTLGNNSNNKNDHDWLT